MMEEKSPLAGQMGADQQRVTVNTGPVCHSDSLRVGALLGLLAFMP